MFREFELIMWSCFSDAKHIKALAPQEELDKDADAVVKRIMSHLINSAYYCKRMVVTEEEFRPFKVFFNNYFQTFEGKHTDWLLLEEPDVSAITLVVINNRYVELKKVHESNFAVNVGP